MIMKTRTVNLVNKLAAVVMALTTAVALGPFAAGAKGHGDLERPVIARMKAADIFLRPWRNYECTLESVPTGSWFLDQKVTVNTRARGLDEALEAALSPYEHTIKAPVDENARVVKAVINGRVMEIRDVTCKAIGLDI